MDFAGGDDNGSNNNSAIDLSRQLEKDRREAEVLNGKHCVDQQRFWKIQVANMMLTSSLTLQMCDVQFGPQTRKPRAEEKNRLLRLLGFRGLGK